MAYDITDEKGRELEEAFRQIESEPAAEGKAASRIDSVANFCRLWPDAKGVLLFLEQLPGTPGPVKLAIALVIKAGDLAAKILC